MICEEQPHLVHLHVCSGVDALRMADRVVLHTTGSIVQLAVFLSCGKVLEAQSMAMPVFL